MKRIVASIALAFVIWTIAGLCFAAFANWSGPTDPKLHEWFDGLKSGKGLCCSFADGLALDDPDWGTEPVAGADGKQTIVYWVVVEGKKIPVPPDAVVTEPNRYGRAVVWPYEDFDGITKVRCFLPGPGA